MACDEDEVQESCDKFATDCTGEDYELNCPTNLDTQFSKASACELAKRVGYELEGCPRAAWDKEWVELITFNNGLVNNRSTV